MKPIMLILIVLCLIGVINSYITPWTAGHIIRGKSLFAEPEEPKDDKKQNTRFARGLDDFVGKRYGAGEAFYGKRKSEMSEEDFQAMRLLRAPKQEEIVQDLRNNAILVVGGIEDVNQWAVFDLLEKGFNIRVATTDKAKAVESFGLDGENVDIVVCDGQYGPSPDEFEYLMGGVQAAIFADNLIVNNKGAQEECVLAQRIMKHVIEQQKVKGRDELKKVVLVSHAGGFKGGKGIGNKILDKLFNPFGRAEGGPNEVIGKRHAALEKTIRDSGYDYVIVRTPPIVQTAGDCSEVDLELTQESSFESPAPQVGGVVGLLDLAETAVQALIQDFSGISFTVRSVDEDTGDASDLPLVKSSAMEAEYGEAPKRMRRGSLRVPRPSYYNVLDMQDREMKTSYLLRDTEVLKNEIDEDAACEAYWADQFSRLALD